MPNYSKTPVKFVENTPNRPDPLGAIARNQWLKLYFKYFI